MKGRSHKFNFLGEWEAGKRRSQDFQTATVGTVMNAG
jgi:hypothetical protein